MAPASMSANLATAGWLLVHVVDSPGASSFVAEVMPGHVSARTPPRTASSMSPFATVTAVLPLFVRVAVYATRVPAQTIHKTVQKKLSTFRLARGPTARRDNGKPTLYTAVTAQPPTQPPTLVCSLGGHLLPSKAPHVHDTQQGTAHERMLASQCCRRCNLLA
jgi:hypothetical protein